MPLNDVVIKRTDGGLGRKDRSEDMVCGLMSTGVAVVGGVQLNTTYNLKSIEDLAGLQIDEAYDATNTTLLYYHISEFFRMNPNGELYLRVAAQTAGPDDLVNVANTHARQMLQDANGRIRVLGVNFNPPTGYVPVLTGGLDADVLAAIPLAQALAASEFTAHRPVMIILEGLSFNGTSAAATDLRAQDSEYVQVCIAQDPAIAALDALYAGHAAIGTVLGTTSAAKVNENIGWVEKFPVTDTLAGRFGNAFLSSNLAVSSYTDTSLNQLNDKGYIFLRPHTGWTGFYWNDPHTCTAISSDYAYGNNVRTLQKAARLIRASLLPKLASPVKVNPTTGKLQAVVAKGFETRGYKALNLMMEADEISGRSVYVDPDQDILATSKLVVKHKITPTGDARVIEGEIGFDNPF